MHLYNKCVTPYILQITCKTTQWGELESDFFLGNFEASNKIIVVRGVWVIPHYYTLLLHFLDSLYNLREIYRYKLIQNTLIEI